VSTVEDLQIAIEAGDAASVKSLLVENPELANSREKTPPPLHFMVWCNLPKMVELLLDHGADIESRDQDNDTTPVRYAIVYGRKA
jgi:ankyrin repeat protein